MDTGILSDIPALLGGLTPAMIFLFLLMAVVLVMFYLTLKSVDDLTKAIRADREAELDGFAALRGQLEDLIRVQFEIRTLLAAQKRGQPTGEAPEDASGNITSYIVND